MDVIPIVNSIVEMGRGNYSFKPFVNSTLLHRGGGTCLKLGAQLLNSGQNWGAQNLPFPSLRLKYWVRKCAPLRIRLHHPCRYFTLFKGN